MGEQFGPYKLVRRLGVGGMAETFVAVRSGPGGFTQRVCLKLVLPFFREDEDFTRLFYREATLAAKLRHRSIVGVMDFGEFEGTPYMALELVDGPRPAGHPRRARGAAASCRLRHTLRSRARRSARTCT